MSRPVIVIPQHDTYVCNERSPHTGNGCTRAVDHEGRHLSASSITFDASLSEVEEVWGEDVWVDRRACSRDRNAMRAKRWSE